MNSYDWTDTNELLRDAANYCDFKSVAATDQETKNFWRDGSLTLDEHRKRLDYEH